MLFLLALLFFSLSTSVTTLPMNALEHHPQLLPLAYSITTAEVPSRYHGCWTLTIPEDDKIKIRIPFVFCQGDPKSLRHSRQHFYGAAEAIQVGGYVDSLLRYKRVMSEEQLEEILGAKNNPRLRAGPYYDIKNEWKDDILQARVTSKHSEAEASRAYRMMMGDILRRDNPRSQGCWTPIKHPSFMLCINKFYEVFEYPVGVECDRNAAFKRVSTEEEFTHLLGDSQRHAYGIPLPNFFSWVEGDIKDDQAQIMSYAELVNGVTYRYYTILVRKV